MKIILEQNAIVTHKEECGECGVILIKMIRALFAHVCILKYAKNTCTIYSANFTNIPCDKSPYLKNFCAECLR